MGYMFVIAPCYCCKTVFTFNASLVPSIRIEGDRKPICRYCVERVNPIRKKNGLAAIQILPGAYDAEECQ